MAAFLFLEETKKRELQMAEICTDQGHVAFVEYSFSQFPNFSYVSVFSPLKSREVLTVALSSGSIPRMEQKQGDSR